MERYVDGDVLPVPADGVDEYRGVAAEAGEVWMEQVAAEAGEVWMEHGAIAYFECLGDDLEPDVGDEEMTTFPEVMEVRPDESVIFAFVVFESREHRDEANAAAMEDPATNDPAFDPESMPFDAERMVYGGFRSIVGFEGRLGVHSK